MEFKLEDIEETFNGEIVSKISNNEYLIKIQDKEHHIQVLDINSRGMEFVLDNHYHSCLLYTSPSPRDMRRSRMPSSA